MKSFGEFWLQESARKNPEQQFYPLLEHTMKILIFKQRSNWVSTISNILVILRKFHTKEELIRFLKKYYRTNDQFNRRYQSDITRTLNLLKTSESWSGVDDSSKEFGVDRYDELFDTMLILLSSDCRLKSCVDEMLSKYFQ